MMPLAGRITDRAGPGAVVLGGLALILAGTVPFAIAGSSMSYPMLSAALFIRGLGMGAATMPAMAGAYASLDDGSIAQAAGVLNVLKRVGGSLGVAIVAVVLEHGQAGGAGEATPAAGAFANTFWLVFAFCALAFIPAAFLPRRPAVEAGEQPSGRRRIAAAAHSRAA